MCSCSVVGGMLCKSDKPSIIIIIINVQLLFGSTVSNTVIKIQMIVQGIDNTIDSAGLLTHNISLKRPPPYLLFLYTV